MQYPPVIEDCASQTNGVEIGWQSLLSGLPGLSCSQYSLLPLRRISAHFLAASYHSVIIALSPRSVPLSSLFHLT